MVGRDNGNWSDNSPAVIGCWRSNSRTLRRVGSARALKISLMFDISRIIEIRSRPISVFIEISSDQSESRTLNGFSNRYSQRPPQTGLRPGCPRPGRHVSVLPRPRQLTALSPVFPANYVLETIRSLVTAI